MNKGIVKIALVTSLTFITSAVYATHWELNADLGLSYAEVELPDGSDGEDELNISLEGAYYLNGLNTDIGPLDQAEFLSKASKITAGFSEHGGYQGLAYRFDPTTYGKTYNMGFKGVINDYILAASYSHGSLKGSYQLEDIRQNQLSLSVGGYLNDTTTLIVSYLSKVDNRDYLPQIGSGVIYKEERGLDLAAQHFKAFSNGQAIAYGANLSALHTRAVSLSDISGYRYELGAHISYHPTKYWTLKAVGTHTDFQKHNYIYKRSLLNFTTRYYFAEAFAMNIDMGHISGEDELGDVDGVQFKLGIKSFF